MKRFFENKKRNCAMLIKKQEDEGNIVVTEEDISLTNQGSKILKENMENVVSLPVKLVADLGVGDSWLEAK